jgi:hypothetical protein
MIALNLKRNELVVTYLDTFEKLQPGAQWIPYYQAQAFLDLGRISEASEAIEREAQRAKGGTFHVTCVRAAIAASARDAAALRDRIGEALATPLYAVENLTGSGLINCLTRLWGALAAIPDEPELRIAVENRCLASGLLPAGLLNSLRRPVEREPDLQHYVCMVDQPLDDRWKQNPARLVRQDKWKGYRVRCGILAKSEDQARQLVLDFQQRCAPLPATIASIEVEPRKYADHPGVTWRDFPVAAI